MFAFRNIGWKLAAAVAAAIALGLGLAKPGETASTTEPYVVQAGDTLWSIAESRYDGDPRRGVWQIREANELGKRSIMVGQVLELPTR